jgi:hypothetical protein
VTKRILVVEDQEDDRRILSDLLRNARYELAEAENGEEALASVAKQRPDLILMDIRLPILDGCAPWTWHQNLGAMAPKIGARPRNATLLGGSAARRHRGRWGRGRSNASACGASACSCLE